MSRAARPPRPHSTPGPDPSSPDARPARRLRALAHPTRPPAATDRTQREGEDGTPADPELAHPTDPRAGAARTEPDAGLRAAWLRAEACCECVKEAHGQRGRCNQFLIWGAREGTGKGAWAVRALRDPKRPPCEILCVECYTKLTGHLPAAG